MKKNFLVMISTIVLVGIMTTNVYAKNISLEDLVTKFNEIAASEYNSEIFSVSAGICTKEQDLNGDCEEGAFTVKTTTTLEEGDSSSIISYVTDEEYIYDAYITDYDSIGFMILIRAVGEVNGYGYDIIDLIGTLSSEEANSFTVSHDGIEVKETETEGLYYVAIDITKKLELFKSHSINVYTSGDGGVSLALQESGLADFSDQNYAVYKEGTVVKVKAKADEGYKFVGWTLNDTDYSTEDTIDVTLSDNIELVANFDIDYKDISEADITLQLPRDGEKVIEVVLDEYEDEEDGVVTIKGPDVSPVISTDVKGLKISAQWITGVEDREYFYGTFEKGKDYYLNIDFDTEFDYKFVSTFLDNLKINGEKPEILSFYNESESYNSCIVKVTAIDKYEILDGDKQTYESGKELSIRANGNLEDLVAINVDNACLDSSKYTLTSGSTIVTLKPSYLDTLSIGEHTLTFVYNDGEVGATFTVLFNEVNPATGDDIMFYVITLVTSMISLAILGIYLKRKRFN